MPIELVVVTPEGQRYAGPVDEVVLPGSEGEFGVLESHEHFLSALGHGCMEIRKGGASELSVVSDGFAEVGPERVVVMVESMLPADEIDVGAARAAEERAADELAALDQDEAHAERRAELEDALARARAELAVVERR